MMTGEHMNQTTPQKKEKNSVKEPSAKPSDKEKTKSGEPVTKENQVAKTKSTNQSASQRSISHFSSVSTPEYREGWNRIFGKDNVKNNQPSLQKLSISDVEIDPQTRTILTKFFKKYALKQGFDVETTNELKDGSYSLECIIRNKQE